MTMSSPLHLEASSYIFVWLEWVTVCLYIELLCLYIMYDTAYNTHTKNVYVIAGLHLTLSLLTYSLRFLSKSIVWCKQYVNRTGSGVGNGRQIDCVHSVTVLHTETQHKYHTVLTSWSQSGFYSV